MQSLVWMFFSKYSPLIYHTLLSSFIFNHTSYIIFCFLKRTIHTARYQHQFSQNNQPTIVINFCISKYKPITSFAFLGGASGKEPTYQCRRHKRCRFDPWAGKILWRGAWQLTLEFLPGESHGQRSLADCSP